MTVEEDDTKADRTYSDDAAPCLRSWYSAEGWLEEINRFYYFEESRRLWTRFRSTTEANQILAEFSVKVQGLREALRIRKHVLTC